MGDLSDIIFDFYIDLAKNSLEYPDDYADMDSMFDDIVFNIRKDLWFTYEVYRRVSYFW